MHPQPPQTVRRARRLRRQLSLPEVLLWARLRRRPPGAPKFRRQHPIGPYVLDFYCEAAGLAVEVDGAQHGIEDHRRADEGRDAWLAASGVRVLRVPAAEVLRDPNAVAEHLWAEAAQPLSRPADAGRQLP